MSAVACGIATHVGSLPARAGIGLRAPHYRELLETRPSIGWLEVHSENYFGDGGAPLHYLERLRSHYPVSLHGVGLSLGSTDPLNQRHLSKLLALIERIEPALVSEHLCWSSVGGQYFNDLLPLPYTEEALAHVGARIGQTQDFLQREILIENVSSYVQYRHSTIPEAEFIAALATHTGCGILLDVNNIYVSATNHGFDPCAYIDKIPAHAVSEIHLAGFAVNDHPEGRVLIDNHGAPVADAVWTLYRTALAHCGPTPTLIEWDSDIPPLAVLLGEARKAETLLANHAQTC